MVTGGVTFLDSLDAADSERRDHRRLFGALGIAAAHRLSKEFEVGGNLVVGASVSQFPNLVTDSTGNTVPSDTINGYAATGIALSLNPSYNLNISVEPALRYNYNLGTYLDRYGAFPDYDGFYFGIGLSLSYRFGQDPDAPGAEIRALRLGETSMPPVFAAMQSVYVEDAITEVKFTNTEDREIRDLELSFFQNGYMDSPTPSERIERLAGGDAVSVPLYASFNGEVFRTNGITPLTGEIIAKYTLNGRDAEQRFSVTYDLHDRNALTWSDDRKVAAFITPSDSAVRNYASYVRTSNRELTNGFLPEPLQFAMQSYVTLAEQGLLYQVDPSSPFTRVQENTELVDSISLPRETLTRITGDCDDITVLFNTMLESAGYESAFVTIPGHIYSAVNTKVPASEYDLVHPNRDMSLIIDGEVWVLIEITLIGETTFMEAWSVGMRQWHQYEEDVDQRGFYQTRQAQGIFRPVGLVERDLGLQYPAEEAIQSEYSETLRRLSDVLIAPYRVRAQESDSVRSWNRYGIRAAKIGRLDLARSAFRRVAQLDPEGLDALVNLGSVEYLSEEYRAAFDSFRRAASAMEQERRARPDKQVTVYLNMAKAAYRLEDYDEASRYYEEAAAIDPEQVSQFAYIGAASTEGAGRASEAASGPPILFSEGDE